MLEEHKYHFSRLILMWKINHTTISLEKGDITDSTSEAIVNAANTQLILGAGVAGAIRRKGGPVIQDECDKIGRIELGQAAITSAGEMKAKYVIHAASMHLGSKTTADSLEKSLFNSLNRGAENNIKTIAFPAIGTGISGFLLESCAEIMLSVFRNFLTKESYKFKNISIVLYQEKDYRVFKEIFGANFSKIQKTA